ncbi:TIGR02452 family protein [Actinoplanes nipponensis]|nr:TIGR02452 family protein [Actinoplanes nipponensis]
MSERLRAIARETVAITERGWYHDPGGTEVRIDVAPAVAGTRLHLPTEELPAGDAGPAGLVEVTGESTLAAARRLGGDVAALVFASARSPGGGFLNGAQAQEESIARSSGLYPCLRAAGEFYTFHRSHAELTYSDRVIYSPGVPVFRDDRAALLTQPYPVSFLTAAAPNLGAIRRNQPDRAAGVPEVLRRRAARILAVAAAHGHRRLVLGAWGCGVFGNDPTTVAEAFAAALAGQPMVHVVFAVLGPNRAEFAAVLAGAGGAAR